MHLIYANKIEAKHKEKTHFANKPTGQTSNKKSPDDSHKFKNHSQSTPPKPNHQKKNFKKEKRDHNKQAPTGKWCDYHIST